MNTNDLIHTTNVYELYTCSILYYMCIKIEHFIKTILQVINIHGRRGRYHTTSRPRR